MGSTTFYIMLNRCQVYSETQRRRQSVWGASLAHKVGGGPITSPLTFC